MKYTLTSGELIYPNYVYIAEGNTFLGIMSYPHFIAAALYILVFYLVLQGERSEQFKYAVAAGLVALFFGWQHAYDLVWYMVFWAVISCLNFCATGAYPGTWSRAV
jgi:hypothetical protein